MTLDLKPAFSRFLAARPERLHAAAHSHHPWPDVTRGAHLRAWQDAANLADDKWDRRIFGQVIPAAQRHVAGRLSLPNPATLAFAPNTHEFVVRILSCFRPPARILTTDSEFHSFARQVARYEEAGSAQVVRVASRPYDTFSERFAAAAGEGGHDLVFFSHVLFDSAAVVDGLAGVVAAVPDDDTFVVVDGYHGFMALPTDLSAIAERAFYVAGGYKYAMAGEGAVFLHCPPGYGPRPPDTGWFARFGALDEEVPDRVPYGAGGRRFMGATFDPSGLYRFNAVQDWLDDEGVTVADIHAHVHVLQHAFLDLVDDEPPPCLDGARLLPPRGASRGHFLTFETGRAGAVQEALRTRRVVVDHRRDRLRLGFGVHHDAGDIERLVEHLHAISP